MAAPSHTQYTDASHDWCRRRRLSGGGQGRSVGGGYTVKLRLLRRGRGAAGCGPSGRGPLPVARVAPAVLDGLVVDLDVPVAAGPQEHEGGAAAALAAAAAALAPPAARRVARAAHRPPLRREAHEALLVERRLVLRVRVRQRLLERAAFLHELFLPDKFPLLIETEVHP